MDYRRPLPRSQIELVMELAVQQVIRAGVVRRQQTLEACYGGRSDALPQWALLQLTNRGATLGTGSLHSVSWSLCSPCGICCLSPNALLDEPRVGGGLERVAKALYRAHKSKAERKKRRKDLAASARGDCSHGGVLAPAWGRRIRPSAPRHGRVSCDAPSPDPPVVVTSPWICAGAVRRGIGGSPGTAIG